MFAASPRLHFVASATIHSRRLAQRGLPCGKAISDFRSSRHDEARSTQAKAQARSIAMPRLEKPVQRRYRCSVKRLQSGRFTHAYRQRIDYLSGLSLRTDYLNASQFPFGQVFLPQSIRLLTTDEETPISRSLGMTR